MDEYESIVKQREIDRVESRFPFSKKYESTNGSILWVKLLSIIVFFSGLYLGGYLTYLFYNRKWYLPFGDFFSQFGMIGMLIGLLSYLGGAITFLLPAGIFFFISITLNGVLDMAVYDSRKNNVDSKVIKEREVAFSSKMASEDIINEIAAYKESKRNEVSELREQVEKLKEEVNEINITVQSIYSGMIANLTRNIKPVDWQYIDLLIYYFETGRASTYKEALNLLEQQIVTNQIVKNLSIGTQYITESIKNLGGQINHKLSAIDSKINDLNDDFKGEISNIHKGIDYTCSKIDVLKYQNQTLYKDLVQAQRISSEELAKSISNMEFKARFV